MLWKPVFLCSVVNKAKSCATTWASSCTHAIPFQKVELPLQSNLVFRWQIKYEETAFKDSWASSLTWLLERSPQRLPWKALLRIPASRVKRNRQQLKPQRAPSSSQAPTSRPLRRHKLILSSHPMLQSVPRKEKKCQWASELLDRYVVVI